MRRSPVRFRSSAPKQNGSQQWEPFSFSARHTKLLRRHTPIILPTSSHPQRTRAIKGYAHRAPQRVAILVNESSQDIFTAAHWLALVKRHKHDFVTAAGLPVPLAVLAGEYVILIVFRQQFCSVESLPHEAVCAPSA